MDYPNFLRSNVEAFLAGRGIAFNELRQLASRQGFGDARLLLTSSPVHGIATPTSDIDLICLCQGPVSTGQMATQIHHDGHHVEVLPFAAADVQAAFMAWGTLANGALHRRLKGYQDWDQHHALRLKYLERLVYGVTAEGDAPFLVHQDETARIVAANEFDTLHQNLICACLSTRAGEPDAAQAYLLNGALAAMNLLLSQAGWVLSNRKWTLRRWQMVAELAPGLIDAGLYRDISALWMQVQSAHSGVEHSAGPISHGAPSDRLGALARIHRQLLQLVNDADPTITNNTLTLTPAARACKHTMMDTQAAYLHDPQGGSRLESIAALPSLPSDINGLDHLPPATAARVLRGLRSGEWHCSLSTLLGSAAEEIADVAA
ncbi:DUF6001 family protein [Roseateles sp. SL47]|uniref:DUF6001 family protein n=1 Tax=Roseateles sp. SL47 TaxID=2995138 RepID=UPI00226F835D|nr:DUF6001 family protein [Roseateles sp. SL47]WAC71665.1 DUF6001 family protein [Roseateles sp. SL47]